MAKISSAAFCPQCGGELQQRHVQDERRDRLVCQQCERIHYLNPNVVAGAIPVFEGRVWLLRRGIEPRYGAWTFPAGFMELGESVAEAAVRETREELNMDIQLERLLNVYSRPSMTNIIVVYVATALTEPSIGHETLDFASFAPTDIPWDGLAFWNTHAALKDWIDALPSHDAGTRSSRIS